VSPECDLRTLEDHEVGLAEAERQMDVSGSPKNCRSLSRGIRLWALPHALCIRPSARKLMLFTPHRVDVDVYSEDVVERARRGEKENKKIATSQQDGGHAGIAKEWEPFWEPQAV
jgi:hypothetical protein